jgi:hypothetical protein
LFASFKICSGLFIFLCFLCSSFFRPRGGKTRGVGIVLSKRSAEMYIHTHILTYYTFKIRLLPSQIYKIYPYIEPNPPNNQKKSPKKKTLSLVPKFNQDKNYS